MCELLRSQFECFERATCDITPCHERVEFVGGRDPGAWRSSTSLDGPEALTCSFGIPSPQPTKTQAQVECNSHGERQESIPHTQAVPLEGDTKTEMASYHFSLSRLVLTQRMRDCSVAPGIQGGGGMVRVPIDGSHRQTPHIKTPIPHPHVCAPGRTQTAPWPLLV